MNSVQFGRWFSERRRACGWPSQRLLVEAVQQHTLLQQSGISEDFLARLEAGHLASPFRGTVRRRILLLAWLLCKTARDLKTYVKAAGLGDFSDEEQGQLHLLQSHLEALQTPPPLLLPPRPSRLQGRTREMEQLMHALSEPETHVVALTGMSGIGKSALAHEALHRMVSVESDLLRHFPDGVAAFACTGRQGTRGLISLLTEITDLFTANEQTLHGSAQKRQARAKRQPGTENLDCAYSETETELASIIDRTRAALANKRVLLLLDDLDAAFPLRQALDVLMTQGAHMLREQQAERVILTTSRFIPAPAQISTRLHLQPLTEEAALELLVELVGEELSEKDQVYARRACTAIGYLPLAIESMATAIQAEGIPLSLVATHLATHPLDGLLTAEEGVVAALEKALAVLDQKAREQYILLAALGTPIFDLEAAGAVLLPQRLPLPEFEPDEQISGREAASSRIAQTPVAHAIEAHHPLAEIFALNSPNKQKILAMTYGEHIPDLVMHTPVEQEREKLAYLASTASLLGQFVRHSLLDLLPGAQGTSSRSGEKNARNPGNGPSPLSSQGTEVSYSMHTLLHTYAREMAQTLPDERLELARHNLLSYALTYATQHTGNILNLERVAGREVVLAGLELAWNEKHYESVICLARNLLPMSGRMAGDEGERILQRGLYAGQQLHDQKAIILFLDRLASLHCYRGDLLVARQMWEAALHIQETLDPSPGCWRPLAGLAHLAHIQGDFQAAWRFSEAYVQKAECAGDREAIIQARARRAFYARLLGQRDQAHGDLLISLRLIREIHLLHSPEHERELIEMETRTELARVEGDYPRAQAYAEATIVLMRELYDQYNVVDILYDQACFALQQGLLEDARNLARQAAEAAVEVGAPHFYKNSMRLLQTI